MSLYVLIKHNYKETYSIQNALKELKLTTDDLNKHSNLAKGLRFACFILLDQKKKINVGGEF